MDLIGYILNLLAQNSIALALLIFLLGILYWAITHPTQARQLGSNIGDLGKWVKTNVFSLKSNLSRRSRSRKDQRRVNDVIAAVGEQAHINLPKARIHYKPLGSKPFGFQRNGVVDLDVPDTGNVHGNILQSTMLYLETSLLSNLKGLKEDLVKAIHLMIIFKLLKRENKGGLCSVFWSNIHPNQSTTDVEAYLNKLLKMDENGTFTGMAISELYDVDRTKKPKAELVNDTSRLAVEVDDFINFVESVGNRKYGERTPLEYNGKYIKVSVLLIGKLTTRLFKTEPYIKRIQKTLKKGIERIYVVAVGWENTAITKEISREISTQNFENHQTIADLKEFRSKAFNFKPAIISLLVQTRL